MRTTTQNGWHYDQRMREWLLAENGRDVCSVLADSLESGTQYWNCYIRHDTGNRGAWYGVGTRQGVDTAKAYAEAKRRDYLLSLEEAKP